MSYIPSTDQDRRELMQAVGISSIDELFQDIPEKIRNPRIDMPLGLSEPAVRTTLQGMAKRNADMDDYAFFLGGGAYRHHIPAVVDALVSRSEFYTAYTPYQAEMSQGMLQSIYEFQTMICRLTGMDVSNASLYDGATALAEAINLARSSTKRGTVLMCAAVNPLYRQVVSTYAGQLGYSVKEIDHTTGYTNTTALEQALDDTVAACVVQYPNFFGGIQDFTKLAAAAHARGALLIVVAYPLALGLLKAPAVMGADVVCGDGQSLGLPLSYGGPYVGFLAAKNDHLRRMPGRIVGQTLDNRGQRGFVLTLQAREQHIRREKATSNICSNQALCALAVTIYLSTLGKQGLHQAAQLNAQKAHYAAQALVQAGATLAWSGDFFNEFVITTKLDGAELLARLREKKIIGGLALDRFYPDLRRGVLVTVTELNTRQEIDFLTQAVKEVLA
jgi:glycine dehydrogenase subunit 1